MSDSADERTYEIETGDGSTAFVSRSEYLARLPEVFRHAWDDPVLLSDQVIETLTYGFPEECLEPGRRLMEIDTMPDRAICYYSIALNDLERFDESIAHLEPHLETYGGVLTLVFQLGRAYAGAGRKTEALEMFERSLDLAPNSHATLKAYKPIKRELQGDLAYEERLGELAADDDNYWALYFIADLRLEQEDYDALTEIALRLLDTVPLDEEIVAYCLARLGQAGYAATIVDRFADRFDPGRHHPHVGLNILEACLRTDSLDTGRAVFKVMAAEYAGDEVSAGKLMSYREGLFGAG